MTAIMQLLLAFIMFYSAFGYTINDCAGAAGYHCTTNFDSFTANDAAANTYNFVSAHSKCIWNNKDYVAATLGGRYQDIHVNSAIYPDGFIHVTFVGLETVHCYSADDQCIAPNAHSHPTCFNSDVRTVFKYLCNRFFVKCEAAAADAGEL